MKNRKMNIDILEAVFLDVLHGISFSEAAGCAGISKEVAHKWFWRAFWDLRSICLCQHGDLPTHLFVRRMETDLLSLRSSEEFWGDRFKQYREDIAKKFGI